MTVQEQLLYLLRLALKNESADCAASFDIPALMALAKRHGVFGMLYFGLLAAGVDKNNPDMRSLWRVVGHDIFYTENQFDEVNAVLAAFEQAGIAHMQLKGMVLRNVYPAPEMRVMGDMDILVKTSQFPQIDKVMQALGFTFVVESAHEYIWKKDFLQLELHKYLFAAQEKDFYGLYGDGWKLCKQVGDSCRYTLSPEDQFIYVFLHFLKHYRNSGIGLRHLTDMVVLLQEGKIKDFDYVKQQMDALGVGTFYQHVRDTIAMWMEGAPSTPQAAYILQTVCDNGSFGTADTRRTADIEAHAAHRSPKTARFWRIFSLLFPSSFGMKMKYPFLRKVPFLIPLMWPVRWVHLLLCNPSIAGNRIKEVQMVSVEDIQSKRDALAFVGLQKK